MYSLIFLGGVSFVISLLLTPFVRNWFRRHGIVDQPDQGRKLHHDAIPRVGGIAIVAAYLLTFGILLATTLKGGVLVAGALPLVWKLFPSACLIFGVGLMDDLLGLKPWEKFLGQGVAAALAYWAGVRIHSIHDVGTGPWWSLPVTILWLVACTNAVNLIDGVDGLAAGIGLFASATTLLAGLLQNNVELAMATVPLVGCLLGFLRYNFNPATIFLGDSGSLFIGFLLGCYGVLWSQKSATILGMTAPLMALAIPLLDTGLAIARRFLRHQPLFTGDRGHIHHRLLDRGLTPRRVALVLYAVCGISAAAALTMTNRNFSGFIIIAFCGAAWLGIQHLGYVEFGVVGRMFVDGAFRRLMSAQISLQTFERDLSGAMTSEQCWEVLRRSYNEFGFSQIRVRLGGNRYSAEEPVQPLECWEVRVPLADSDYVNLRRQFGPAQQHTIVAAFVDVLRKVLTPKLAEFDAPRRRSEMVSRSYETATAGD